MKFKHIIIALFIILLPACKDHVNYITADKAFVLSLPKDFKKGSSNSQADLHCVSKDDTLQMDFFSYRTEDLAETADSGTLLEICIAETAEITDALRRPDEEEIYVFDGKYIRQIICTGMKENNIRHYYIFSSVDFYENPEVILIVLQIVPVSKYAQYKESFRKTIESAKVN